MADFVFWTLVADFEFCRLVTDFGLGTLVADFYMNDVWVLEDTSSDIFSIYTDEKISPV